MELRLTYEGQLLGASRGSTRADHKHAIRRALHPQLRRFWQTHPVLRAVRSGLSLGGGYLGAKELPNPLLWESLAEKYERVGYNFVPLVKEESMLICSLNILFLRADMPGAIVNSGDIDNRLKTLFDALRMPTNKDEVPYGPSDDEKPFFVLLEDDKLITHLSVETDTLLEQVSEDWDDNDVRLIISVKIKPYAGMMTFD
jgi:hypothetical protein